MDFTYKDLETPNGEFRISPSQIASFFNYPSVWYKENFLGEKGFTGNTASTLGTIIHAIAEAVAKGEDINRDDIEKYLDTITDPDIDKNEIRRVYPDMAQALVNEYLMKNMPDLVEQPVMAEIDNTGIYVGGTYDAIRGSTLIDYKTTNKKPSLDSIPFHYLIQLLAYYYALDKQGTYIDRLRIVWVVKPTKTLPARVFVVNHMITDEDKKMIKDTLELMAETITVQRAHPELTHLLYKSMNLKEN